MSFPAARMTSTTAHGGTVTIGTPLTLIGNMPASRIGDLQTCPMVTVLVPHVGGPIMLGAFNVLTGGPPQSRMLDMTICVGPPGIVLLGHMTTLVGMAGAFSGGIGGFLSLLAGGFLAGLQNLLGDGPRAVQDSSDPNGYYTQYRNGVRIRGTPEFQARVVRDLDRVSQTDMGRRNLDRISNSGHTTTIVQTNNGNSITYNSNGFQQGDGSPGSGSDSTIYYNPDRTSIGTDEPWMTRTPETGLAHELGHGGDVATGTMATGTMDIDGRTTDASEAQATGLGPYANNPNSENAYRQQTGQTPRTYY